jgi:hypothetical protein
MLLRWVPSELMATSGLRGIDRRPKALTICSRNRLARQHVDKSGGFS